MIRVLDAGTGMETCHRSPNVSSSAPQGCRSAKSRLDDEVRYFLKDFKNRRKSSCESHMVLVADE